MTIKSLTFNTGTAGASLNGYVENGVTFSGGTSDIVFSSTGTIYSSATVGSIYPGSGFTPASANYNVSADIRLFSAAGSICIFGRRTGNDFYVVQIDASDSSVVLYASLGGTFNEMGRYTLTGLTYPATIPITLKLAGTSIKVSVNGVDRISATDANITATGSFGVRGGFASTATTGTHIDSLTVDDAPGGTVTISDVAVGALSTANITATVTATGSAPLTYAWHRSTTSGFTPSGGTLLSGQTSATLTDTTAIAETLYFYKVVVTDSTSATLTSNQVIGKRASRAINVLFIGDSISSTSYNSWSKAKTALQKLFPNAVVNAITAAVSGSRSNEWISGSGNLNAAKNAAVSSFGSPSANNPIWVSIMLGINDCRISAPGNTPTQYRTNMQSMLNDLVSAGYKIVLNAPPILRIPQGGSNGYDTEAGMANLLGYVAQLDSLCDGVNIIAGDRKATGYFATALAEFTADASGASATYVHPNAQGEDSYAVFWSQAIANAINPVPRKTRTIRF